MRTLAAVTLVGVVLAGALAGGCHVKAGNENTVTGTIAGVVFRAKEGYATQGTSSPGIPPIKTWALSFFVSDGAAECTADPGPGSSTIEVTLTRQNAPIASGTYGADGGISDGVQVTALFQRLDDAGNPDDVEAAIDGSVVLEVLQPDEVRGTLSLTFPHGSVTGSFLAPFCGADAGQADAAQADAGSAETGHVDAEQADVGQPDATHVDAESADAETMDAASDRTVRDAGPVDACEDRRGDSSTSCGP